MSTDFENFFVGTYSEKGPYVPNANGEGILCCSLNLDSGEIKKESVFPDAFNATYLAKDSERNLFAACDYFERIGEIQAFKIKEKNVLERLSISSSKGQSTCHLCADNEGKQVYGASYMDGKLSRHSFDGESLEQNPQVLSFEGGGGPNKERQEAAHIHQAEIHPDGKWLYACDLGSDAILQFRIPESNEQLQLVSRISAPPGSGPRHLVFHPNKALAYLFCELDSMVLTYTIDENSGNMSLTDRISSLPEDFNGIPAGAAIKIHPSAKTLYVSNRNHNSISVFKIDKSGSLSLDSIFSSEGEEPRDFSIDPTGNWLLAANQDSDNIVPFRLDPQSGLPEGSKGPVFRCGTPVCILFQ